MEYTWYIFSVRNFRMNLAEKGKQKPSLRIEFYLREQSEILPADVAIPIVVQEVREEVRELITLYGS